ncbi:MAG TPA: inositol monophosphatase family protein [Alphaproteobacteria bacterium]|nr:inositol monophosphatase family protein [Alphaproteobacteria bacterium]
MKQSRLQVRPPHVNVMVKACELAGRSLIRDFNEVEHLRVSRKSPGDFVCVADSRSEKIIMEELSKARPEYGIISEESGVMDAEEGCDYTWIIDPLDGTTNFLHGLSHFCVTVALKKGDEIVSGVIYDPIKDELFWAEKGMGAYLNQGRIRVSQRKSLELSLLATGIPFGQQGNKVRFLKNLASVMPLVSGVRRFGVAALDLAYVACGRFDAYFEEDIKIWDIAAGVLLVKEAGGMVSEFNGGKDILKCETVLASNVDLSAPLKHLFS